MPGPASPSARGAALSLAQRFSYRPPSPTSISVTSSSEATVAAATGAAPTPDARFIDQKKKRERSPTQTAVNATTGRPGPAYTVDSLATNVQITSNNHNTTSSTLTSSSITTTLTKKRKLSQEPSRSRSVSTVAGAATASPGSVSTSASPSTTITSLNIPAELLEIASSFEKSLSDKPLPGLGGLLSERDLLRLEVETLHPSWLKVLQKELKSSSFLSLKRFLWSEGVRNATEASKKIFPPAREIYSWSRFTPLRDVRVVILGQDPYHNDGQAHGLCFSVRSNVKTPPSLKNIYKEIKTDYPHFTPPNHGYLGSWARQGVLLINTAMTVRAHQANSHSKKGWEEFTDSILRAIDARPGPGVVFLAWGQPALKRINNTISSAGTKHLILSSAHPSPLSASRGFFGNAHFRRTNEWLVEQYGNEEAAVDWCNLEPEESSS